VVGTVQFVLRDVSKLDLARASTELVDGWMTSVEETLLDLAGDWPRWPVGEATRADMSRALASRASRELLIERGAQPRRGAKLTRALELLA
jgi:hypothetical protein